MQWPMHRDAIATQHDVFRLDVTMHDAMGVGGGEGALVQLAMETLLVVRSPGVFDKSCVKPQHSKSTPANRLASASP